MTSTKSKEYKRGYRDGYAMREPEHIEGKPEPIYRPVAYPAYTDGHKAGRHDRMSVEALTN